MFQFPIDSIKFWNNMVLLHFNCTVLFELVAILSQRVAQEEVGVARPLKGLM